MSKTEILYKPGPTYTIVEDGILTTKLISRFKFNQDDYPKGTFLLREYEYKGYFIREFEQEPCEQWKKCTQQEDGYDLLTGGERGWGCYEILNSNGEIIEEDFEGMGDSATCNAENEIDHITKSGWLYEEVSGGQS